MYSICSLRVPSGQPAFAVSWLTTSPTTTTTPVKLAPATARACRAPRLSPGRIITSSPRSAAARRSRWLCSLRCATTAPPT